jgi:predicted ribosome quality control (RQC) complex YloA/Tae2 family protein
MTRETSPHVFHQVIHIPDFDYGAIFVYFYLNVDNNRMISNFFTILHVGRSLNNRCTGARITDIYTQEKRRLCITTSGTSIHTIVLSCVPAENAVYAVDDAHRARANAADLFPEFIGKTLSGAACDGLDRVLSLRFTDNTELRAEFFGVRANVVAYDGTGRPIDCFLGGREQLETRKNASPLAPLPVKAETIVGMETDFFKPFRSGDKASALIALKSAVPKLGTTVAEDVLFERNILPSTSPLQLSDENLKRLYDSSLHRVEDLLDYSTERCSRIYWDDRRPVCFSLFALSSKTMFREEIYADCSEGIRRFIGSARARESFDTEKNSLRSWMQKELTRCERTLTKMDDDAVRHNRAEEYQTFGTLLMAYLHQVTKGMTSIVLNDFTTGDPHAIPLDPALSPAQNAERYYSKAKHAKAARTEAIERHASLTSREASLRPMVAELDAVHTRDDLKSFRLRCGDTLKFLGYMTDTEREQLPPFRIFTVDGGFQVLAGKSSENNDLLTTRYAKANDLWFHARGSSGSHVVLKIASGHGVPSKKAIHQAASIAAYYSKMKNASAVPVAMTEKKFVHKPRGVPAGTVTLDREKVIFAEPKLPDDIQST